MIHYDGGFCTAAVKYVAEMVFGFDSIFCCLTAALCFASPEEQRSSVIGGKVEHDIQQ
jgi:hypothetical protein